MEGDQSRQSAIAAMRCEISLEYSLTMPGQSVTLTASVVAANVT